MKPERDKRQHLALTVLWVALAVPGVLWWRNSVPFLVAVSIYANVAGHWSAYQAACGAALTKEGNK